MSPAVLLTLTLVAAAPRTLASPGLTAINIDERVANFYGEFFAQELAARSGLRVVTQAEVSTLLGIERQKQLLGCSEESTNCMAELAGALGADGVVMGSIARLGSGFAVTLKVISPGDARTLAARTGRSANEDTLLDWLTEAATLMAGQLGAAFASADAGATSPLQEEVPTFAGNPKRIARGGKLFSELETARYFVAKRRGASEADALLAARNIVRAAPPDAGVVDAGITQEGPRLPLVPAPLPRRVARGGKVLTDAQTRRYYEARGAGKEEAAAFAWALTTPREDPPSQLEANPPASVLASDAGLSGLPPLPPGLPRRIARDARLLSVEETERYFREKLGLTR